MQWQPTHQGYLNFLAESKLVYDTLEQIVAETSNPDCEINFTLHFLERHWRVTFPRFDQSPIVRDLQASSYFTCILSCTLSHEHHSYITAMWSIKATSALQHEMPQRKMPWTCPKAKQNYIYENAVFQVIQCPCSGEIQRDWLGACRAAQQGHCFLQIWV